MLPAAPSPLSFSVARKWSIGLSVALSTVAVLALLGMANYLAVRYFVRLHWTAHTNYLLSPLTRQVLRSLTNEVRVTIFFSRDEALYRPVLALINEYRRASPKIVVREMDLIREPSARDLLKNSYSFGSEKDVLIFESNGKTKAVLEKDLSQYDASDLAGLMAGQTNEIRRTGFKGEQLFTSAILTVSDPRQFKAYFLTGHGEHDPGDNDPQIGYSKFAALLRRNNILAQTLNLGGSTEIPSDCQLMIIAGPKDRLDLYEREKIDKYLNEGGRLLALLSTLSKTGGLATTGMELLLRRWGVEVGDNQILDPRFTLPPFGLITTNFLHHALVRSMHGSQVYLYLPRSIEKVKTAKPPADAPQVDELFVTSPMGRAVTDVRDYTPNPSLKDRRGSIALAVAVEKGGIQGINANRGSTRMVIVGESYFLNNLAIDKFSNDDFGHLCVNWLLDRAQLLAVGPRPMHQITLAMTQSQMNAARWALLGGMPGSILLAGLLVWWRRRH